MQMPSFRGFLFIPFCLSSLFVFFTSCVGIDDPATDATVSSDGVIAKQRLEQIKATKKFKVAVCPKRPPLIFKNEKGQASGIEVELTLAVAGELGLEPIFFECSQEQIPGLLRAGEADLACAGIDGPSIIRQYLCPVLDYMPSGQRLIVRSEGAAFVNSAKQFDSDKITLITVVGSTGTKVAETLFPNAKKINVRNFDATILELKASENAAILADNIEVVGRDNLRGEEKVKPVLGLLTNESLSMAMRRNDNGWKGLLEIGMRRANASGELGRIIGRYFPNVSCEFLTLSADFSSGEVRLEVGTPAEQSSGAKSSEKLPPVAP